jgi:Putative threonine/serine exporter
MGAIEAVNRLVDDAGGERLRLDDVHAALDVIEHQPPIYPRWLVVAGLGVTAAKFAPPVRRRLACVPHGRISVHDLAPGCGWSLAAVMSIQSCRHLSSRW